MKSSIRSISLVTISIVPMSITTISKVTVTIPIVMVIMSIAVATISIVVASVVPIASIMCPLITDLFRGITTMVTISIATKIVAFVVTMIFDSIAMIHQVHSTEIIVAIGIAIRIRAIRLVAGSGGTRLHIAVAIGAEHERPVITKVESIIATLVYVLAMVGVGFGVRDLFGIPLVLGCCQTGQC